MSSYSIMCKHLCQIGRQISSASDSLVLSLWWTRLGEVGYRLQLPEDCLIHPVFHVSQLKQAISLDEVVSQELPDPSLHFQVPQAILDRRLHLHRDSTVPQVQVKWSNLPPELSTWKDEEALRQKFPRAQVWGQAVTIGGRDVTNAKVPSSEHVPEADEPEDGVTDSEPEDGGGKSVRYIIQKRVAWSRKPNSNIYGPNWV